MRLAAVRFRAGIWLATAVAASVGCELIIGIEPGQPRSGASSMAASSDGSTNGSGGGQGPNGSSSTGGGGEGSGEGGGGELPCDDPAWARWSVDVATSYQVTNDTVLDQVTSLMWERNVPMATHIWDDARKRCEDLTVAGYSDWRLPTRIELVTLVHYTKANPAIDESTFGNNPSSGFWTASRYASDADASWVVAFTVGLVYVDFNESLHYSRCVR